MSLLNPFDKRGREESSFIDRAAIAILWLFVMIMTVLLPILIYRWYKRANQKSRVIFWIVVGGLGVCGILLDELTIQVPAYLK